VVVWPMTPLSPAPARRSTNSTRARRPRFCGRARARRRGGAPHRVPGHRDRRGGGLSPTAPP